MDTALTIGSVESLRDFLQEFFDGKFCDTGLFCQKGQGVMGLIEKAADGKVAVVLDATMTMDDVCFMLAKYEPKFVVVDAPLWESKWGRTLMQGLAECVPVKDLGGFKLKTKVLFVFPMEERDGVVMGPDVPEMGPVVRELLWVVYEPA